MPPIWPVQEAIHAWAENKFAGLCHGSAQKDAPLYFLSPVWISEAPWGCVQLCLREAGSPLGTRKSREAQWSFLAPCLGDLAAIPRKGITDVKLDSGIGDGTGCILDIRVLSVAAFLRRTMAEHNWIIHVSEIVCKASFKNFYFGNLKHIQKMERIAPWICGGPLLWYSKSQDCCNKLPKPGWLSNRHVLSHSSEG